MTKPREIARDIIERFRDEVGFHSSTITADVDFIADIVTAAVAAETERCIQAVKDLDAAEADAMGVSCRHFEMKLLAALEAKP